MKAFATMKEFLYILFNMTLTSKMDRWFMLAWTSIFAGYEAGMICFGTSILVHVVCLILQVSGFIMYFRAKIESKP